MLGWGGGAYLVSKAIRQRKQKEQIMYLKELCKHMEIGRTGSDLMENKLSSSTESVVVEIWKNLK